MIIILIRKFVALCYVNGWLAWCWMLVEVGGK